MGIFDKFRRDTSLPASMNETGDSQSYTGPVPVFLGLMSTSNTESEQMIGKHSSNGILTIRVVNKMIERETLDELIAEGKVFNVITAKNGNRMAVPQDVARSVWNRDGG